jgi:hypothetical protein
MHMYMTSSFKDASKAKLPSVANLLNNINELQFLLVLSG